MQDNVILIVKKISISNKLNHMKVVLLTMVYMGTRNEIKKWKLYFSKSAYQCPEDLTMRCCVSKSTYTKPNLG